MEYEEFISCHPKLIDWNKSWEFVFKYTKPLFDKYNTEWFYKWIIENCNRYELLGIWNKIDKNWRILQKFTNSRICPWCGLISNKKFISHINNKHNKSLLEYVLLYNNLSELPKCANPNCKNKVHLNNYYNITETCSKSCHTILKHMISIKNGTHNFLSKNLIRDEYGKSISHIKMNYMKINKGIHPFVYCGTDEHINKVKENKYKWHKDRVDLKTHNWMYSGDPERDKLIFEFHSNNGRLALLSMSRDHLQGKHSYPEDLLGDILFKLNIDYIREYPVFNAKYRIDYYLPDFNVGLECDGEYKKDMTNYNPSDPLSDLKYYYKNKYSEISNKLNIIMKHIWSQDIVHYYNYNKRELYKLIIKNDYPLIKLSDLTNQINLKIND